MMTEKNSSSSKVQQILKWASAEQVESPSAEEYCETRDVFQARLDRLARDLESFLSLDVPLLIAAIGEIGNNSFDHNLGNWRDLPGVLFQSDPERGMWIIADRGQGVLKTIQRVKPEIKDDAAALQVAWTEIVSGRAPERRGNGLKLVRKIVHDCGWTCEMYSGIAHVTVNRQILYAPSSFRIFGCVVIVTTQKIL